VNQGIVTNELNFTGGTQTGFTGCFIYWWDWYTL